jgi:hypothetical protein
MQFFTIEDKVFFFLVGGGGGGGGGGGEGSYGDKSLQRI